MKYKILLSVFVLISFCGIAQTKLAPSEVMCKPSSVDHKFAMNPGILPEFIGGDSLLQEYIAKNLVLNNKLHKEASGLIIKVSFDIDTLGKIYNVKLINREKNNNKIEETVINLVCGMPDWKPGVCQYADDSLDYPAAVIMYADVHFWKMEDGKEKPAYIDVMKWPKSNRNKPKPHTGEGEVFTFAEVMPSFEYGKEKFIKENLKYPAEYKDKEISGTVYIAMVVEKDGSITNIQVVRSIPGFPLFDAEAIRVISLMPKWTPATLGGKPIRVELKIPVKFGYQ
ncbi:MAG: energy transducer TonB [Bacteroidia bacterium]